MGNVPIFPLILYAESGVHLQDQALTIVRGQVADIISGSIFLFLGLVACGIAAMRWRRSGMHAVIWLGIWSAMYGTRPLVDSLAAVALLPPWFQATVPYLDTVTMYLILVVASLAFRELTTGKVRLFLQVMVVVGLAIGLAGIGFFLFTGSKDKLIPYNQLLAACLLSVLVTVVAVPRLSRKFLVLPERGVLVIGTLVFAVEALYVNLSRPFGYQPPKILDSLGFAVLLFSLGYVSLRIIFANERRLLSIENELAIARKIQTSILPSCSPELNDLRITAAYRPMTAVAGDFYEFIPVDQHRVGVLMADVSGHGVPAALIAAMIKVAMQSVVPCAYDPREVLRGLNRILSGQLQDQFVTAAYLWLDTENHRALYSAAGHPPLLRWREGKLERIESNGLVFGITSEPDYPVCDMRISAGDRFLLYTDGVIEAENAKGDAFGDRKLEQVVRNNHSRPPSELSDQLLAEIREWQPVSMEQQDDITLVVIDVV
jgi:phosphoserine phosphatase RsbU/P